ncbi:hypothetical protein Tco_1201021 [Tanacetum coccineum]
MVNVIPPDHMDDVPVVEPNQHDDVLVVPEPVLVDKDEDPKEEEFEEEEEPQEEEEEDDMEVDIEEDENKLELTYPYKEVDPLNPPPPASESELEDVIEVENTIESEDETIPASVHEVGKAKDEYYGSWDLDLGNECVLTVDARTATMEKLVKKLVQAHEFYQEMIHRGFVFEERPNEAIDVLIEDEKSPSSEPRGSPHDS